MDCVNGAAMAEFDAPVIKKHTAIKQANIRFKVYTPLC
jgi:hypothetical protein